MIIATKRGQHLSYNNFVEISHGLRAISGTHIPLIQNVPGWQWSLPDDQAHAILAALRLRGVTTELELRDE